MYKCNYIQNNYLTSHVLPFVSLLYQLYLYFNRNYLNDKTHKEVGQNSIRIHYPTTTEIFTIS